MRPLVLNYPDDPRVWQMSHQFLWGDDLLVAPVTLPASRAGRSSERCARRRRAVGADRRRRRRWNHSGLVGRRPRLHLGPSPASTRVGDDDQDLKNQVSVWAMCGLSLTALFQSRDGMLPMVFLMTRTPCDAGEFTTIGMIHSSSSAIFQTSFAIFVRS